MTFELGPGTVLGRYELLAPVAKGGMAQVWMARLHGSRGFHKLVAVKTILTKGSHELRSEAMLLEEARLAALIHHPNIVTTLDLGEEHGVLYLVMEWIHGETLRDVFHKSLTTGGIPLSLSVNVIAQACKGLHAAHEATSQSGLPLHLVHRDISPQNVLLSYSGVVKVADFGIAKAKVTTAELTQPGELKGKVAFMSPEQLACQQLDRRSDVFAMGTLLYTMTTGHHPFRGATTVKTYDNITACNPPKPSAIARQYPADLEHVVLKALSGDRAKRWQTAAEMFSALVETQHGSQGHFESAVAAYMGQVMGDKERERSALIQRCQSASPSSLRPSTPPPSPDRITLPAITGAATLRDSQPPSAESLSPAVMGATGTLPEDGPSTSTMMSFIRGRHRKAWVAAITVGGALVLGVAAVKSGALPHLRVQSALGFSPATVGDSGGDPTKREPMPTGSAAPAQPDVSHAASNPSVPVVNVGEQHISAPLEAAPPSKTAALPRSDREQEPERRQSTSRSNPSPGGNASIARVYLPQELPPAGRQRREVATPTSAESSSATATTRSVDAWDRRQFGGRN
jgi:eukaryotic-like serine/threonine-protein kinase